MIIYLEAYDYDVCAWYRQVIALWVANEAISAGDENSSFLELPRALIKIKCMMWRESESHSRERELA